MIKFKFKFGKETISATVPGSWEEVTTEQFIKMDYANWDGLDIVEIIAIISGVDLHKLYVTKSKPLEAVYETFPSLQYHYEGTVPIVKLRAENPELFYELSSSH